MRDAGSSTCVRQCGRPCSPRQGLVALVIVGTVALIAAAVDRGHIAGPATAVGANVDATPTTTVVGSTISATLLSTAPRPASVLRVHATPTSALANEPMPTPQPTGGDVATAVAQPDGADGDSWAVRRRRRSFSAIVPRSNCPSTKACGSRRAVLLFLSAIDGGDPSLAPGVFVETAERDRVVSSSQEADAVVAAVRRAGCADDVYAVGAHAPSPLVQGCAVGNSLWNSHFLGCVGHVAAAILTRDHASLTAVAAFTTAADANWTAFAGKVCADVAALSTRDQAVRVTARFRNVNRPAGVPSAARTDMWAERAFTGVPQRLGVDWSLPSVNLTAASPIDNRSASAFTVPTFMHVPRCLFAPVFHAANGLFMAGAPLPLASLAAERLVEHVNRFVAAASNSSALPSWCRASEYLTSATTLAVASGVAAYWPTNLTESGRRTAIAEFTRFSRAPWVLDVPLRRDDGGARRRAAVEPRQHSFYPPAVAVMQGSWERVTSRGPLHEHFKTLRRIFRRLVVVSSSNIPGWNDGYGAFSRGCFHKSFPVSCWLRVAQLPQVRLGGGLFMVHADVFFDAKQLFGDVPDNAQHVLMPRQEPGEDRRKRPLQARDNSVRWYQPWRMVSVGTTRAVVDQRNRAAARIAAFVPPALVDTASADACYRRALFASDGPAPTSAPPPTGEAPNNANATTAADDHNGDTGNTPVNDTAASPRAPKRRKSRQVVPNIDEVRGFAGALAPRVLNQGDVFYIPDRALDLATTLLEAIVPTALLGEPSAGWVAEMVYRATGGNRSMAYTPENHAWRTATPDKVADAFKRLGENGCLEDEAPDTVQWRQVSFAGGCCSGMTPQDIANPRFAAGHKVRLRQMDQVAAMTARLRASFKCNQRVGGTAAFAPGPAQFASVLPSAWKGQPYSVIHSATTCALTVEDVALPARCVVVVPNSLSVFVRGNASQWTSELVLHTPSVHRAEVRLRHTPAAGLRIRLRTGVTKRATALMAVPGNATPAELVIDEFNDEVPILCRALKNDDDAGSILVEIGIEDHSVVTVKPGVNTTSCAFET